MKNIEFTEEHKSKLLEMCKVLFPKYNDFELEIDQQYDGSGGIVFCKNAEGFYNIHWFEFCMTHLAHAVGILQNRGLKRQGKEDDMISLFHITDPIFHNYQGLGIKHPVDHFYDIFKKYNTK